MIAYLREDDVDVDHGEGAGDQARVLAELEEFGAVHVCERLPAAEGCEVDEHLAQVLCGAMHSGSVSTGIQHMSQLASACDMLAE